MLSVFYHVQGFPGENYKTPNLFYLSGTSSSSSSSSSAPTVNDLIQQCPLTRNEETRSLYHWRFRVNKGSGGFSWKDLDNLDEPVPLVGGNVVAKLLRLDCLQSGKIKPKKIGISRRDATYKQPISSSRSYVNNDNHNPRPVAPTIQKKQSATTNSGNQSTSGLAAGSPNMKPSQTLNNKPPVIATKKRTDEDALLWAPSTEEMEDGHKAEVKGPELISPIQNTVTEDDDDPVYKSLKTADERAMYRINKRKETEARNAAQKIQELREEDQRKNQAQIDRDDIKRRLGPKIETWTGPEGNRKPIRALLASLHTILWEGANWKPCGVLVSPDDVRKAYRVSMRLVHPDKVSKDAPAEQKYIAEMAYQALVPEWNKFEKSEMNKP